MSGLANYNSEDTSTWCIYQQEESTNGVAIRLNERIAHQIRPRRT